MGIILLRKVGGTIQGFLAGRRKNYCFTPLFAKYLPRHATSKLGLLKENTNQGQKVGGQNIVCPQGKKMGGGGTFPLRPPPNYAHAGHAWLFITS